MLSNDGKKEIEKIKAQQRALENEENPMANFAGCTAVVTLVSKTEIVCANAGDSRAVVSKKGKAKEMSIDHKPDTPSEKRRIENAGGYVEEGRVNGVLSLSRSLGDFEYK